MLMKTIFLRPSILKHPTGYNSAHVKDENWNKIEVIS